MPRTKPYAVDLDRRTVQGTIDKYMKIANATNTDVCRMCGFSPTTWKRRYKNPDELQRKELKALCKGLKIPDEEKVQLI